MVEYNLKFQHLEGGTQDLGFRADPDVACRAP